MKLLKIEAGHYESEDGRVEIRKLSPQEDNAGWWRLYIDGDQLAADFEYLREARGYAERHVPSMRKP